MNEPVIFISESYDSAFLTLSQKAFATILERAHASGDPRAWQHRLRTFDTHGLVTFIKHHPLPERKVDLDQTRLNDRAYLDSLIKELKKPIPIDFTRHTFKIERERLDDPAYLGETAAILAFMWAAKLLPGLPLHMQVALLKLDADTLETCLDRMHNGQSTADGLTAFMLTREFLSDLDRSPAMVHLDKALAWITEKTALKAQIFAAQLELWLDRRVRECQEELGAQSVRAREEIEARFDRLLIETQARFAATPA